MNCLACNRKSCRQGVSCGRETSLPAEALPEYGREENQKIVRAAAKLVDHGRAGTLSRLEELGEFIRTMEFSTVGLAYCYGMEKEAEAVAAYLRNQGASIAAVSCTAGGMAQNSINTESSITAAGCNPIQQARELNSRGPGLVITLGLCLGHDILFNRYIEGDVTNLAVKDRVHAHRPLEALKALPFFRKKRYTETESKAG